MEQFDFVEMETFTFDDALVICMATLAVVLVCLGLAAVGAWAWGAV